MNIQDIFRDCNNTNSITQLQNALYNLNGNETIDSIRQQLNTELQRIKQYNENILPTQFAEAEAKYQGKYFKVTHKDSKLVTMFRIDKTKAFMAYHEIDVAIWGEELTNYQGNLHTKTLKGTDEKEGRLGDVVSNHGFDERFENIVEEITEEHYNLTKSHFEALFKLL